MPEKDFLIKMKEDQIEFTGIPAFELTGIQFTGDNIIKMKEDPIEFTGIQAIEFTGIQFTGNKQWSVTCPCGVTVLFPLNGLPEKDVKHPCGNPDHWTIRFKDA